MTRAASIVLALSVLAGCPKTAATPTVADPTPPAPSVDAAPTSCAAAAETCYDGPCSNEWLQDDQCNRDMYEMYGGACDDTNDALLACQRAHCPGIPEPTNGYAATACPDWTPTD